MNLNLVIDSSKITDSIVVVNEFVSFLRNSGMYYYFPFSNDDLNDPEVVQGQVNRDIEQFHLNEASDRLSQYWIEHSTEINNALTPYLLRKKLTLEPLYTCALTCYGPYGYYYTPNIVYLNITKGTVEEHMQTILHELLHLVLRKETDNMSDMDVEHLIDNVFIEIFGAIFPAYKVQ